MLCPPYIIIMSSHLGQWHMPHQHKAATPRMKLVALCEGVEISLCETKKNVGHIRCKKFTNKTCFPSRRNLDATVTCDKMCHSLSTLISHLPTLLTTKSKRCLRYQYRMGEAKRGVEVMSAFLRFSISSSSCEF